MAKLTNSQLVVLSNRRGLITQRRVKKPLPMT
jgi:hypothetical protein